MFREHLPHSVFKEWGNSVNTHSDGRYSYTLSVRINYTEQTRERRYISQAEFIISSDKKEEVIMPLMSIALLEKEKEVLSRGLRSTLKKSRLSEEYASLIEEHISDEDYEAVMLDYEELAKPYSYKVRRIAPPEVALEAKIILDVLDEELSSDEIAEILELDVMDVETALTEYSRRKTTA